jgi:cell division transport system ATP-binding protein
MRSVRRGREAAAFRNRAQPASAGADSGVAQKADSLGVSATIGPSHEPEQPSWAAAPLSPVLDDDSQTDATMTALAEPEQDQLEERLPARADPSGSAMIVFEGVHKTYDPGVKALQGVSFTIDKGEFVFVVGASGSGKSTVIRLLLKEIEPTHGRIIVGGRDLARLKGKKVPLLRRNLGCVFQDFKLLPNRTAAENIGYALRVQGQSGAEIRRKVPEVLNLVGLAHKMNSRPEELSGGEQQRVSIARAFVNHPPLLVCDEPTGNLDPDTSVGIMQLLYRINRTGTTILMVTHDREMVDKMRKRVIALETGRLVRDERRGGYTEE